MNLNTNQHMEQVNQKIDMVNSPAFVVGSFSLSAFTWEKLAFFFMMKHKRAHPKLMHTNTKETIVFMWLYFSIMKLSLLKTTMQLVLNFC